MHSINRHSRALPALATIWAIVAVFPAFAEPPRVEIQISSDILKVPYSGKLYLLTTERAGREPMQGPGWCNPEPFFAFDVQDVKGGQTLKLDPSAVRGHPIDFADLPPGRQTSPVLRHISLKSWPTACPGVGP